MGAVLGLLLGAGCFLVWSAFWVPAPAAERRSPRRGVQLQDLLVQAGVPSVTPRALVGASAVCGVLVLVVALAVSRAPTIALCFGAMSAAAPIILVRSRARSRRIALREVWPDVVDHIASGVRAGLSLPEAVAQVADRCPEELRPAFLAFAQDHRATGRFGDCLDALKDRLADPVADRLVEALRITREVGGADLGRLLRTLSGFLREDARTRGELEARQSWTVNAARIAVAAPWVVLGLLSLRPDAARSFDSAGGLVVLALGAGACVVAYRLMVRIGRLPDEARVLR